LPKSADINSNGETDIVDVIFLSRYSWIEFGPSPGCLCE